ncbi:MAG: hypothetical protein RRC07_09930, partial [Anaerolineae bacterium]|nr:hypothetical protein [Anaerolineae bacterium]
MHDRNVIFNEYEYARRHRQALREGDQWRREQEALGQGQKRRRPFLSAVVKAIGSALRPRPVNESRPRVHEAGSARVLFVLAMGIVLLTLSSVAWAAAPERRSQEVEFEPMPFADCGDFELLYAGTAQFNYTLFYDNGGNLVRVHYHHAGVDRLINAETGKEVAGRYAHMAHDDLEGTFRETGLFWPITLAGSGATFFAAGHVTIHYDDTGAVDFNLRGIEVADLA